jgi:transposase
MGSTRCSFTEDYKAKAVTFVMHDHRPMAEVARNIYVREMTLGKWVKKARDSKEAATPPDALLDESERVELVRLRADIKDAKSENAQLLMQVDFAKKVATWFAKDKP